MSEPLSSYRLQLNRDFDFHAAGRVVSYLSDLGIDYVYCSPYLQAAPGSTHGYDVVDHSKINEELGGAGGLGYLTDQIGRHGMHQMLDIVPNHMAITGRENPWWWDVLENGPSSTFAAFFDVDWDPPERRLSNTVMLPVLEDQYGIVLEAGKLQVAREPNGFVIRYGDLVFPVAPRSLQEILGVASRIASSDLLGFLGNAFVDLPLPSSMDLKSIVRRHRDKKVLGALLARALSDDGQLANAVDTAIAQLNADHDRLHEFLERQNYRLAYWRLASRELGYRRFFDINSLVGLRMESDWVFSATHEVILRLVADGSLSALRVDHPDGLRDPTRYFERLRESCPDAWIVAEKILLGPEKLNESWPIDGTSGYDFMNAAGGLFVDPAGERPLTEFYQEFTGETCDFAALSRAKKQVAMRESLGSEVNRLTALFTELCDGDRRHRDFSRHTIHEALRATLASFGVYRTYIARGRITELDRCHVSSALRDAKTYRPDIDPRLFDFLGRVLTMEVAGESATELAMRFQQICAAVTAKGVEDTAFYCFNRMIALNEVGGTPDVFGIAPDDFIQWSQHVQRRWPRTMLATSTHDTKRSEDVRARLYLLSEIPERWADTVREWAELNESHRIEGLPDRNFEYHLYQTIVGAWPIDNDRLQRYALKAAREAKTHTTWTDPNLRYEEALTGFIDAMLADQRFRDAVDTFVAPLIAPGRVNSLAQTLIKLVAPGVPDFYQGSELWNLSLVDPDNRNPVDFELRRRLLGELRTATPEAVLKRADEGLPKLWLISRGLMLRKMHLEWFGADAEFERVIARGSRAEHVIAMRRGKEVIAVAPRLTIKLGGNWRDTQIPLPEGEWTNVLTGERWHGTWLKVADLLGSFPVALLSSAEIDA